MKADLAPRLIFLTILTMVAFAANSILCRLSLKNAANDPLSFTLVRLMSGGIALLWFFYKQRRTEPLSFTVGVLVPPLLLFSYALFFSWSYVQIGAGTGALVLFASVQLTMMAAAYIRGQRLTARQGLGFLLAVIGFTYLLLPGLERPPIGALVLMVIAGVSWGLYSLFGQIVQNPVLSTARNFLLSGLLAIPILFFSPLRLNKMGFVFAVLSGAVTSGLGYTLWYRVLKELHTSTAAIVQLSVPALAAMGGILFLDELLQPRLVVASLLIFSGIVLKIYNQR